VGQPINLTMTLSATGLSADALPPLSLPAIQGATVYPDQPKTSTAEDDALWQGSSERHFAVVPERPGTLTMPATTLRWFDVTSGQERTAEIPAYSITVLPAAGTVAAASSAATPVSAAGAALAAATPAGWMAHGATWRWIALASLLLWLLTLLAWWLWRCRSPRRFLAAASAGDRGGSSNQRRQAFLAAVRDGDALAQWRSLLAWAQAERPAIRNAGELQASLADAAQQQAIAELQRACYGDGGSASRLDLAETFKRGFAWRVADEKHDDDLPPLYPFKLH